MEKYNRESTVNDDRKIELLKDFLNLDITQDVMNFENVDCAIYSDSSADGYDLYIVTNDTRHISVCENVYYYDHDLADAFKDQVRYGDTTFYIDNYVYEDCYFEDTLLEMFIEYVEDIVVDLKTEITEEEMKQLVEEYGIENEETAEA